MKKESKTGYLSLAKAVKLCDYSQDYLSLRARQGKLKALKIGRNWVTTRRWLEDYISQVNSQPIKPVPELAVQPVIRAQAGFISLHKAAQECGYSQEYLGLRARQGKLKAVKFGRNWVTKLDWLNEYIVNFNNAKVAQDIQEKEPAEAPETLTQKIKQEIEKLTLPLEPVFAPSQTVLGLKRFLEQINHGLSRGLSLAGQALKAPAPVLAVVLLALFGLLSFTPVGQFAADGLLALEDKIEEPLSALTEYSIGLVGQTDDYFEGLSNQTEQVFDFSFSLASAALNQLLAEYRLYDKSLQGQVKQFNELAKKQASRFLFSLSEFNQGLADIPGHFKFYLSQDARFLTKQSLAVFHRAETDFSNLALSLQGLVKQTADNLTFFGQTLRYYLSLDLKRLVHFAFNKAESLAVQSQCLALKTKAGLGFVQLPANPLRRLAELAGGQMQAALAWLREKELVMQSESLGLFNQTTDALYFTLEGAVQNSAKIVFQISSQAKERIAEPSLLLADNLQGAGASIKRIALNVIDKISSPFKLLVNSFKRLTKHLAAVFNRERDRPSLSGPELTSPSPPASPQQGLIVLPSTSEDEQVKERIKKSFSDEVRVEPGDDSSGIIVPIFREREGDEYLYIMVPINE